MLNSNTCLECGKSISTKAKRCGCGWKVKEVQIPATSDHRCQYQVRGKRCPLFAASSSSIYGNGIWYCSEHCRNLGDPQLCEAILINAEKNYESIIEERIDWRRKLFTDELKIIKANTIKKEAT